MMLNHIRRTRLVMGAVVGLISLAVLLRRWTTTISADAHLRRAKSASQMHQPQYNLGESPILDEPGSSIAHDSTEQLVSSKPDHVIELLISEARFNLSQLLGRQPLNLGQAAGFYRQRRGRHPPPGFGAWYAAAKRSNALIIEEFFDRIYDDLAPFWGLDAKEMQWRARHWPQYISVRDGKASFVSKNDIYRPPSVDRWLALMREIASELPDMDIPLNIMDEPRVVVPFDQIAQLVSRELEERRIIHPREAISYFEPYDPGDGGEVPFEPGWVRDRAFLYWNYISAACPPDAPARAVPALNSPLTAVEYPTETASHMLEGFVRNATLARDICYQPHMRSLHGAFLEAISMSTTTSLLPLFGGAKFPQNNDIVLPSGSNFEQDSSIFGIWNDGGSWDSKKASIFWRGPALGGRNKAHNWRHFHRHRFVQMLNGSAVTASERGEKAASPTFNLLDPSVYGLDMQREGRLGEWVSRIADVGFTHLECFPAHKHKTRTMFGGTRHSVAATCPYTDPWYRILPDASSREVYGHKFVADLDGNTHSRSWRSVLQSASVPLKATLYTEWHDDRLVPWVHYIPIDVSYMDIYGVLDYFLNHPHGDANAQRIATDGQNWAQSVYRQEDMKLYFWRVFLEYARVLDRQRHRLAFVDDLVGL